jgi:hypothetical protein
LGLRVLTVKCNCDLYEGSADNKMQSILSTRVENIESDVTVLADNEVKTFYLKTDQLKFCKRAFNSDRDWKRTNRCLEGSWSGTTCASTLHTLLVSDQSVEIGKWSES